jgi:hypothetical protein
MIPLLRPDAVISAIHEVYLAATQPSPAAPGPASASASSSH